MKPASMSEPEPADRPTGPSDGAGTPSPSRGQAPPPHNTITPSREVLPEKVNSEQESPSPPEAPPKRKYRRHEDLKRAGSTELVRVSTTFTDAPMSVSPKPITRSVRVLSKKQITTLTEEEPPDIDRYHRWDGSFKPTPQMMRYVTCYLEMFSDYEEKRISDATVCAKLKMTTQTVSKWRSIRGFPEWLYDNLERNQKRLIFGTVVNLYERGRRSGDPKLIELALRFSKQYTPVEGRITADVSKSYMADIDRVKRMAESIRRTLPGGMAVPSTASEETEERRPNEEKKPE